MGSFYVNICVKGAKREEIVGWLTPVPMQTLVGPESGDWVCFVSDVLDQQDQSVIDMLGERISGDRKYRVVSVLNHDSSILSVDAFEDGERVGSYNSCPGYFKEDPTEDDFKPRLEGAEAFVSLRTDISLDAVKLAFLGDGSYREAETIHLQIADLLGLPLYSVGMGFTYVSQGESAVEWMEVPSAKS